MSNCTLQDIIKDKDTSIRKYEQEVESLSFRNQQLASRVEVLQGELENAAHPAKKTKVSAYPLKTMKLSGFPLGLENLVKWEQQFPVMENQIILNRLEKSQKTTQNTGKVEEFQPNAICYFSDIQMNCVLLLKWIKFLI